MILAFLLLFIILILIFQQWSLENGLDGLEGDFWPEENVVDPEEPFHITIHLKNTKRFPLFFVKVESSFVKKIIIDPKNQKVTQNHGIGGHSVTLSTWLKANQQARLSIPVSAVERGRYVLIPPVLYCGDFLGFKERQKNLEQFREVVVAPKPLNSSEAKQVLGKYLGDFSVRRFLFEDPVLTMGYREYTGREPLKMISWKQSAWRQTLVVKEYDHTVEPVISVIVNVETTLEDKKELLEKCFSLARSVCSDLENKCIQYDFYTNAQIAGSADYAVTEGLGNRHFMKILELLGRSTYTPSFSYRSLLERLEKTGRKDRGLLVITPDETALTHAGTFTDQQILILNAQLF